MSGLSSLANYGTDSEENSENEEKIITIKDSSEKTRNFFAAASSSESSDSETECSEKPKSTKTLAAELINPFRQEDFVKKPSDEQSLSADKTGSVFANPFAAAEIAERSALEKHVKLAPRLQDVTTINGRKICWNYRKGRCRFGTSCVFAHDSELLNTKESKVYEPKSDQNDTAAQHEDYSEGNAAESKKRKRPGLTEGLIPGKRVMKIFKKYNS